MLWCRFAAAAAAAEWQRGRSAIGGVATPVIAATGRGVARFRLPWRLVCRRLVDTRQTDNARKYSSIGDRITRIIRLCSVSCLRLSARCYYCLPAGRHFFGWFVAVSASSASPVTLFRHSAGFATMGCNYPRQRWTPALPLMRAVGCPVVSMSPAVNPVV